MKKIVVAALPLVMLLATAQAGWGQGEVTVRLPPSKVECLTRQITCQKFEVTVPKPKPDTVKVPVVDTSAVKTALKAQLDSVTKAQASLKLTAPVAPSTPTTSTKSSVFTRKTCNLGTAWAINKNRQIQPGEEQFDTDRDLPVRISRHKTPTSTDVVWEDCVLPKGTAVVCSSGGCWVKVCGNDVHGVPYKGLPGPPGRDGRDGIDGTNGTNGINGADGRSFTQAVNRPGLCSGTWRTVACAGAALALAGGIYCILECGDDGAPTAVACAVPAELVQMCLDAANRKYLAPSRPSVTLFSMSVGRR